jgi:hypothetical protein
MAVGRSNDLLAWSGSTRVNEVPGSRTCWLRATGCDSVGSKDCSRASKRRTSCTCGVVVARRRRSDY